MTYALLGSVITHYFDWLRAVIDQSLSLCLAYFLIHKVSALFKWFCVALLVHDNDLLSGCWCFVWSSPARPACPLGPSRWWRRPGGRSGAARSRCRWPGCLLAWAPWEQSPSPSPSLKHERVKRVTWTPSLFVVKDLLSQLPSLLPTFLFSFAFIFSVTLSEVWEWKEN